MSEPDRNPKPSVKNANWLPVSPVTIRYMCEQTHQMHCFWMSIKDGSLVSDGPGLHFGYDGLGSGVLSFLHTEGQAH